MAAWTAVASTSQVAVLVVFVAAAVASVFVQAEAAPSALAVDEIRKNIAQISASETDRLKNHEDSHHQAEHLSERLSESPVEHLSDGVSAVQNSSLPASDGTADPNFERSTNESVNYETNSIGDRDGRSFWSSAEDTTEVPTTDTTEEQPEQLPEPAALAIPVPSFLANLFSSRPSREPPRPPRARHDVDYRAARRPNQQLGRQPVSRSHQVRSHRPRQVQRRVYRQRQTPSSLYHDHTEYDDAPPRQLPVRRTSFGDYRRYQEELLPDYEQSSHSNHISINTKYDFITEAPYSQRPATNSKKQILDSAAFSIPPSQLEEDPYHSFSKRPDRTGFGSAVNYDNNRFDVLDHKSHSKGNTHDYVEDYDGDVNIYDDYQYDVTYKRSSDVPSRRRQALDGKQDGRVGAEGFFSSVPSLNPLNFFRSSEQMSGQQHRTPATRSSRRRGHHLLDSPRVLQFGRQPLSHETVTESPAFTDYIEFSELEPFYSSESKRTNRRRNRYKAELPPGVGHLEPLSRSGGRRRNSHNTMRSVRFRGSSLGQFPTISDEKILFDPDSQAPNPRRKYDHHVLNDFIVNIPSNEIQYEEVPLTEKDPRLEAFKFKEDYPLRDDLYVGKDGNIYLQDPKGQQSSKTATATADSDDFFGLHMYGMDQPLYHEVSVPQTRHISYISGDDAVQESDVTRLKQAVESRGKVTIDGNEEPLQEFDVTSPRRDLDERDDSRVARTEGGTSQPAASPRFPASGGKTPYMSDFAKSLLKVKRTRERPPGHQSERPVGFRRMKD